ncbi:MAG: hypothetical protein WAV56_05320 [Microgenomates group bacterium]
METVTPQPATPPSSPRKSVLPLLLTTLFLLTLAATGLLAYQNWLLKKQIAALQIPIPTPTVAPIPTTDPTVNWKTYTNTDYGFQFRYPPEARLETLGSSPNEQYKIIYMGKKQIASGRTQTDLSDGYIFYVSVRDDVSRSTVETISQQTYAGAKENCYEQSTISNITSTLINDKPAKTYNVLNCLGDYTEIFVSNGKKIFEITQIYVGEPVDRENYKSITIQILSTFKFIDNNNEGTLEATVIRSPTCAGPVTDQKSCEAPATNEAFKILRSPDNEVVQTVTTDQGGKLTVSLTAGAYQLQSTTSGIGKNIRNPDFTITGGKTTSQRFDVDTGIR